MKAGYVCNPICIEYAYQWVRGEADLRVFREAADPSLVLFQNRYYLFPSKTGGFLVSDNLVDWQFHARTELPIDGYAPDVQVVGDDLYFSASCSGEPGAFYRTKDPIGGQFERLETNFSFWDPHLFCDEDGRLYFYWGCSDVEPLYGVELSVGDLKPLGAPRALIHGQPQLNGYERNGDNHRSSTEEQSSDRHNDGLNDGLNDGPPPYIEGAWMNKRAGLYYLQYASPGTEYNVYSDGVYVSNHPLGPFIRATNNPYSYKPGGFMPGAGHGSTLADKFGNMWHASTMRISVNHPFERRLGLWPAGYDDDGELFCNQRYGDWPMRVEQAHMNPWQNPEWMLLSYGKPAHASSAEAGKGPGFATDEDSQTWWKAVCNRPGEWLAVDLGRVCNVHAVQLNFADDQQRLNTQEDSAEAFGEAAAAPQSLLPGSRVIDRRKHYTRWLLEGSSDGEVYFTLADKRLALTDYAHDLIVVPQGVQARYIRCTVEELPYRQPACISGLRVFGLAAGELPPRTADIELVRQGELDLHIRWRPDGAIGHNVLWGHAPNKLYHSSLVLGSNEAHIGALVKGQPLFVRVDCFNETGITEGDIHAVEAACA